MLAPLWGACYMAAAFGPTGAGWCPMSFLGSEGRKQLKLAARASAVGIEMVLAIAAGYFGGRWLDARFDTAPILAYIGLALGFLAGFKSLWTLARRTNLDTL